MRDLGSQPERGGLGDSEPLIGLVLLPAQVILLRRVLLREMMLAEGPDKQALRGWLQDLDELERRTSQSEP